MYTNVLSHIGLFAKSSVHTIKRICVKRLAMVSVRKPLQATLFPVPERLIDYKACERRHIGPVIASVPT